MPLGSPQPRRWVADHAPLTPAAAMLPPGADPPPYWAPWGNRLGIWNYELDGSWIIYPKVQYGLTGADDALTINEAISQLAIAGGNGVVRLVPAVYNLVTPILPQAGVTIRCDGLTGVSSKGTGADLGAAVLKPAANFNAGGLALPAAVAFVGTSDGGAANSNDGGLEGIWIDMSTAPASVDGVSIYSNYGSGTLRRLVITNGLGNGINSLRGAVGKSMDGWTWDSIIVQNPAGVGIIVNGSDLYAQNVHSQNCGSDCWQILTCFHGQFIGCRGDVSAAGSGIKWDCPIGTNPLDSNQWIGGGTQLNALYGHNITNSRAAGKSDPIKITGGTYDGDTLGGVHVAGPNAVTLDGLNINITSGNPVYALVTDLGSDGTSPPDLILAGGAGIWGGSTGPVLDNAGVGPNLVISQGTAYTPGSGMTTFTRRAGISTLVGGTVTVTNIWAATTSRILVSRLTPGGTTGQLSVTRAAGSFTINSTSGSETSTVTWEII